MAAKAALAPIGMVRKGRSRTWLADRGYILGIVEFQPSAWSRGSYLNVSVMWLWRPIDHLVFEVEPRRVGEYVSFENTTDLTDDADHLARSARDAISTLLAWFDGLTSVIDFFESPPCIVRSSYQGHLGTAYGLLGDMGRARSTLDAALALREEAPAGAWRELSYLVDARRAAESESAFREWVIGTLASTRTALKLPDRADALPPS